MQLQDAGSIGCAAYGAVFPNSCDPGTIAREFDAKSASYETSRLGAWYRAQGDLILEHLSLSTADVVLDIGCGTGYLLRQIVNAYPGVDGIGIDIAPCMVEVARAKAAAAGSPNLTFVQSDWESPTRELKALLAGQPITCAVCSSALHYFKAPLRATRAIHDVLGPRGTLLILERARDVSALTVLWGYLHQYVMRDHVRFYSSAEIVRFVAAAGFGDVEVIARLQKMLWHRKFYTSLALIRGIKEPGLDLTSQRGKP